MRMWTDSTVARIPKPTKDKDLLKHSTPFSVERMNKLSKIVTDLTSRSTTK
jgi:hypothetical protein